MEKQGISDLLKKGERVSTLSTRLGPDLYNTVIHRLYEWWRNNQLTVSRTWDNTAKEAQSIIYSNEECLLPDDFIRLEEIAPVDALKIATWNVNSIRIRLPLILSWLAEQKPDIVCLQETKVEDHQFPVQELREAGYSAVFSGQKSYNGVAILSRFEMGETKYGFRDDFDSENKRLLATQIEDLTIINVYVPQGQTPDSPKFAYKLDFLRHLVDELKEHYNPKEPILLMGDINIAPDARDVVSAEEMEGRVSFRPEEHALLEELKQWGLTDIFRQFHSEERLFSWWDFRTRGFEKNEGMRIDHMWVSAPITKRCESCEIDVNNRSQNKPSDHAPVLCVVKTN